jgi:hypothetical protein
VLSSVGFGLNLDIGERANWGGEGAGGVGGDAGSGFGSVGRFPAVKRKQRARGSRLSPGWYVWGRGNDN